ncbi:molybdenum ABC transporter ATP-binding protein [Palleronia sediminis]|uniref:Molybdenum ABC transporter ATP-binding protein n=1 Tax=Palleronia sediminis TaxID=2547833 RepID=A0A4V3BAQ8_9RHOB|nr:molybdenum ABC transporter ATP-binding protein [Palleronia sediminis]TDL84179.1 molybdenum ABC transporter ATP-binding protein [Palleronia sediminis]
MSLSVDVTHAFDGFAIAARFDAPPGITVLFGRSGSGKTTIVDAVAGLLRPQAGRVTLEGRVLLDTAAGVCLPPRKRRLGYIFQEGRLFPHLSVAQNLAYGRWFAGARADAGDARVIEMLGLGPLLARRPGALSGGEKQRVAIGRALMARPRLILADEPLAALDEPRKAEIMPYFERLRDEVAVPILYVSHSGAEVARLATTVVALGEGRVLRQGDAAEVLGDPRVTPLGAMAAGAVIEARVIAHHPDGLSELDAGGNRLLLPAVAQPPGARLRVRIAATDVILATGRPEGLSALNILPAVVTGLRRGTGPGVMVQLQACEAVLLARITRRSAEALGIAEGAAVHAVLKAIAVAKDAVGEPGPAGGR